MAFLQWRRFNFFEKEIINDTNDTLVDLVKSCQITCSSSGNGFIILGDSGGLINLVSRKHRISSFSAYKIAATHCCCMKCGTSTSQPQSSSTAKNSKSATNFYLVTIGTDSEELVPILKIWSINESFLNVQQQTTNVERESSNSNNNNISNNNTANPLAQCIRSIKLSNSSSTQLNALKVHSVVTALDVLNDSIIAIGFNDGHCLIVKGDLSRDRNVRMKLIQVSTNDSVTNVAFAVNLKTSHTIKPSGLRATLASSSSSSNIKQHVTLFVSTRREICSFDLSTKEQQDNNNKILLDAFGCEIGASCLKCDPKQLESIQFVVGRKDAIYFYNIDGRGPCLAYEGQKLFLTWFRNYLVVVTSNDNINLPPPTQQQPAPPILSRSDSANTANSVLTNPNPNLITIYDIGKKFIAYSCPVPAVGQIVSEWGILYVLTTDGRILVFKECDIQTKLELLFKKNQFSLAIDLAKTQTYSQDVLADMFKQYGDHLYRNGDFDGAINQYCQTLGYLEPSYVIRKFLDLQRIHNLTAYLQEIHKRDLATEDHTTLLINCYVKLKDEDKLNEFLRSSDIVFDVDIAIKVLRQAGYYNNAVMLARKHDRYDYYFSILLEDQADSKTVLDTFSEMIKENKHEIIGHYLSKYGRMVMSDQPDKTTELLKELCLCHLKQISETNLKSSDNEDGASNIGLLDDPEEKTENRPEKYLHIFLNHHAKMIEFLEFIMNEWKNVQKLSSDSNGNNCPVSMEICNTLLEMYMHSYKSEIQDDGLAENRLKIMNFLKDPASNYDRKKAMILCQMSNFIPGVLFLYEQEKMYKQILAHFIVKNDSQNVIETCKKYADNEDPQLWVDALQYFSEIYDGQQKSNISFVLKKIEQHRLLPPLMVVEILSKPGKVTLGVVRNYLQRWIKQQQEQIEENEKLIESYRDECQRTRKHIEDIKLKPKVFQATKCTACLHALELPSVHFMCNHSFHLTCFESYITENDQECPSCLPENRKILNEISMLDNVKNVNELFQQELMESRDPFDVIARYCGQGLFNPLTVVMDDGLMLQQTDTGQQQSLSLPSTTNQ